MFALLGNSEEFGIMIRIFVSFFSVACLAFSILCFKGGNASKALGVAATSLATIIFGIILLLTGYIKFGTVSASHQIEILVGVCLSFLINYFFWRKTNISFISFLKEQGRRMMAYKYSLLFLIIFL